MNYVDIIVQIRTNRYVGFSLNPNMLEFLLCSGIAKGMNASEVISFLVCMVKHFLEQR